MVLRSEQPSNSEGNTSRHRVTNPFPKCISATCRRLPVKLNQTEGDKESGTNLKDFESAIGGETQRELRILLETDRLTAQDEFIRNEGLEKEHNCIDEGEVDEGVAKVECFPHRGFHHCC